MAERKCKPLELCFGIYSHPEWNEPTQMTEPNERTQMLQVLHHTAGQFEIVRTNTRGNK